MGDGKQILGDLESILQEVNKTYDKSILNEFFHKYAEQ